MLIGFGLDVPTGSSVAAVNPDAPGCGSISGTKQMLADLGYAPGPVDNNPANPQFQKAVVQFASERGIQVSGQLGPNICHPLTQEWQARGGGAAASNGGGSMTTAHTPFNIQSAQRALKHFGPSAKYVPYIPGGGAVTSTAMTNGDSEGTMGKAKNWWNERSTGEKAAVAIGGVALVGGIVYLLI